MSLKKMTWEAWGFGFIGAVKGAAATAFMAYVGTVASGLDVKWRQFGITVGMAALVQGVLYIQKSPMPFEVTTEETTTATTTATVTTTTESKQNENTTP